MVCPAENTLKRKKPLISFFRAVPHDRMGNRLSYVYDNQAYSYTSNNLNQYTSKTIPGIIPVTGTAASDSVVKVHRKSLGEVPEAILTPDRNGSYFSYMKINFGAPLGQTQGRQVSKTKRRTRISNNQS